MSKQLKARRKVLEDYIEQEEKSGNPSQAFIDDCKLSIQGIDRQLNEPVRQHRFLIMSE